MKLATGIDRHLMITVPIWPGQGVIDRWGKYNVENRRVWRVGSDSCDGSRAHCQVKAFSFFYHDHGLAMAMARLATTTTPTTTVAAHTIALQDNAAHSGLNT